MEGYFLVIRHLCCITPVYLPLAESVEPRIRTVILLQLGVCLIVLLIIFHQPIIRMPCTIEHGLERQGGRTVLRYGSKGIMRARIGIHLSRDTTPARNIPCRPLLQLRQHHRLFFRFIRHCAQRLISAFHFREQGIRFTLLPRQHSIKTHPLRTP